MAGVMAGARQLETKECVNRKHQIKKMPLQNKRHFFYLLPEVS